jgi:hypothetical protein
VSPRLRKVAARLTVRRDGQDVVVDVTGWVDDNVPGTVWLSETGNRLDGDEIGDACRAIDRAAEGSR